MSDNPFTPPQPVIPTAPGADLYGTSPPIGHKKMPGLLMAICVICLILGAGGLLGSCVGVIGLAVQATVLQNIPMNAGTQPQAKMQQEMLEMQRNQMLPNAIMVGLNFFVAPLLLIGSIGILSKKKWGRKILRFGLLAAVLFIAIKTALTIYLQFVMTNMMTNVGAAPGTPPEVQSMMQVFMIGGIIISAVIFLAMLAFYIFSYMHLNSPRVNEYCHAFE